MIQGGMILLIHHVKCNNMSNVIYFLIISTIGYICFIGIVFFLGKLFFPFFTKEELEKRKNLIDLRAKAVR